LERADLYKDSQVESHHEWEVRRPKLYSQAWKEYQLEVAPSKTRLLELIEQIERREAQKDDRPFQVGVVGQIYNRMLDEENRDE
jgi:hypothetical protein